MVQSSKLLAREAQLKLEQSADPERAQHSLRFFKTGPGQYGEGDVFVGVTVPQIRKVAKDFALLPVPEIWRLLASKLHEVRLLALIILVQQHKRAEAAEQEEIFQGYLKRSAWVNNWDLVDTSAPSIVGPRLGQGQAQWVHRLLSSECLWERRIAMLASFYPIRQGNFAPTLRFARALHCDKHDLIHKAVGWMLREVGNRDVDVLEDFLLESSPADRVTSRYMTMPRMMLRYAIEKLPAERRRQFLKGSA